MNESNVLCEAMTDGWFECIQHAYGRLIEYRSMWIYDTVMMLCKGLWGLGGPLSHTYIYVVVVV